MHAVKSVPGMLPEGAVPWRGRMGETISVRLDRPGVYGVKCRSGYELGMVGLIVVGSDPPNWQQAQAVRHPARGQSRPSPVLFDEAGCHLTSPNASTDHGGLGIQRHHHAPIGGTTLRGIVVRHRLQFATPTTSIRARDMPSAAQPIADGLGAGDGQSSVGLLVAAGVGVPLDQDRCRRFGPQPDARSRAIAPWPDRAVRHARRRRRRRPASRVGSRAPRRRVPPAAAPTPARHRDAAARPQLRWPPGAAAVPVSAARRRSRSARSATSSPRRLSRSRRKPTIAAVRRSICCARRAASAPPRVGWPACCSARRRRRSASAALSSATLWGPGLPGREPRSKRQGPKRRPHQPSARPSPRRTRQAPSAPVAAAGADRDQTQDRIDRDDQPNHRELPPRRSVACSAVPTDKR